MTKYKRDSNDLYSWDREAIANEAEFPLGMWLELDAVRSILAQQLLYPKAVHKRDIYYKVRALRASEMYRILLR